MKQIVKILIFYCFVVLAFGVQASGLVSEECIEQFYGLNINGTTAREVADKVKNTVFTKSRIENEIAIEHSKRQKLVENLNRAKSIEQSYRNIRARDTLNIDSDPYDFIGSYGVYVHTLSFSHCNLQCVHSSVDGVRIHADALIASRNADRALNDYDANIQNIGFDQKIENILWEKYGEEYSEKINDALLPFRNCKIEEFDKCCKQINGAVKSVACQAVVDAERRQLDFISSVCLNLMNKSGSNHDTDTYIHKIKCKMKKHSFIVLENHDGVIKIACDVCSHDLYQHEPKFKKGNVEAKLEFLKYYDMYSPTGDSRYIKKLRAITKKELLNDSKKKK